MYFCLHSANDYLKSMSVGSFPAIQKVITIGYGKCVLHHVHNWNLLHVWGD